MNVSLNFSCEFCVSLVINDVSAAHDGKVEDRIEDYRKIITGLDLPKIVIGRQYKSDGK